MIPKTLHIIWIGDESKTPNNCIRTWIHHNPGWSVRVWGNNELANTAWLNVHHMSQMAARELNGVADMMRWEILYNEGGFLVDADSVCLRPLDDGLLDCEAFACWESEIARPGLIAAGYFGCCPANPFVHQIAMDIYKEPSVIQDMAWKTVGPQRLTDSYRRYQYQTLRILPSHYFIPEHFTGVVYQGPGPVYAHQEWGSTKRSYDSLHLKSFEALAKSPPQSALVANSAPKADQSSTTEASGNRLGADVFRSGLPLTHDSHPTQKVQISRDVIGLSRPDIFAKLCGGQRVLRVGRHDWHIADPDTPSLDLALEPHCAILDRVAVPGEAPFPLTPNVKGKNYESLEDVTDSYDLILVPEQIAHVSDLGLFLAQLNSINAPSIVITVPDAYSCRQGHFSYAEDAGTLAEVVHPDNNCWYSPYTLSNVIRKYTSWKMDGLWFLEGSSLLALLSKTNSSS